MKPLSDEEIQRILENGETFAGTEHSPDYLMYQRLFEALTTEPDFELSADFSEQTVNVVRKRVSRRQTVRYYLMLSLVSIMALALGVMTVAYVNMPLVVRLFDFIWQVKWIAFCGLTFFALIQISDQIVKKRLMHHAGL